MPLLLVVIALKYAFLFCQKFKTSKKLFFINLATYMVFLVSVIVIDY